MLSTACAYMMVGWLDRHVVYQIELFVFIFNYILNRCSFMVNIYTFIEMSIIDCSIIVNTIHVSCYALT